MILRPTLGSVVEASSESTIGVLSPDRFREIVREVAKMLQESYALNPEEQDQLGLLLANLEPSVVLIESEKLSRKSAKNILDLIDRAISVMSENGLLAGRLDVPWES